MTRAPSFEPPERPTAFERLIPQHIQKSCGCVPPGYIRPFFAYNGSVPQRKDRSKQATARILTILILAVALGAIAARKASLRASLASLTQRSKSTPQDTIYAMLDAARRGDVQKYMASYAGEMSQSLARAQAESGDFAKYLRDSNAELKGIAVMEPQPQQEGQVKVRVEYVYQDRNEAQFFYLQKTARGWKISRVETAERVKTIIPYGTPVQ
jgi:hypothetical protein